VHSLAKQKKVRENIQKKDHVGILRRGIIKLQLLNF
jgi:hypothetical protein